ncbi:GLPGLI family protein [Riemerella anatipestifer]|nr:GLPGLI family protein [Riemerella anatipestifer]
MQVNKKLYLIISLFFFSFKIYGQEKELNSEYVAIYNFKFKTDSLSSNYIEDKMGLFISENISIIQSLNVQKRDSALSNLNKTNIRELNFSSIPKVKFNFNIIKKQDNIIFYEKLGNIFVGYDDNLKFDWKILNEFKIIDDYKCQKAILTFRGRDYIAWFSNDIPINDGPYKFRGLPGLIFEIQDTKDNFFFNLISFKKQKVTIRYTEKISFIRKEDFYVRKLNYLESIKSNFNITGKERKKIIYNPIELK